MIKKNSELITFGYDLNDNIYSTPSSMTEYLQGFKAGTIINCRSMNTALKSTTCIINAMLEALGFENTQTTTSLTLSDNDIVKNNGTKIENVNNITYSDLSALKEINNYKSVVKSLFFTLRQFRNINSNSADKIYCHKTNVNNLGDETTLAIYNNEYNSNNYNNNYNYADEVFMHKAGNESFDGNKLTLKTTNTNNGLYTEITQSSVAYTITYNNAVDNRPFSYSVGGNRTNNFSGLYNTFDIGVNNCLGNDNPSEDNTLTNSVIIGCNNTLNVKDDNFNNINLFGNNLTSSNTADNTTIIGHYNATTNVNHYNKVVIGCGTSETTRLDGLVFDGDGIYSSNGNIKIDVNNRKITLGTTVSDGQSAWNVESKGQITAPSFNATSDERLKENITPYKYHNSITNLEVKEFDFKNGNGHHIGCIAQDLQALYPELVHEDDKGYLSIEENKLVYLLLEEVKMLKKRVDELEKR